MLTDDDCRACLKAIGLPAMSPRRFREIVAAINAMPDGPVYVAPRRRRMKIKDNMIVPEEPFTRAAGAAEIGEG